jgi:hypothetical protein
MSKLRRYFWEGIVIGSVPAVVGAIYDMPTVAILIVTTWVWLWTRHFNTRPTGQKEEAPDGL